MSILQFTIPVEQDQAVIAKTDKLPYFYPYLHKHKETQLTWVQEGNGMLVVNNNMQPFKQNDIFFIGANQPHIFKTDPSYFQPKSNKNIVSLDIFFDPSLLSNTLFNIKEMNALRLFLKNNQNGFKVPKENQASITNKMLLIKESKDTIARVVYFIELLRELKTIDHSQKLSKETSLIDNDTKGLRIGTVYNYILQNFDKEITLEDVAKQIYMTPQAFCRFFKKHTRLTFVAFLNEIRVNKACMMMMNGEYENISGIAYSCGFNSIANFNRLFKSTTGFSPSQYINNLKSQAY